MSAAWNGEITLTRKEYAPAPTPDDDLLNPLPPALPDAPAPPSVLQPLTRCTGACSGTVAAYAASTGSPRAATRNKPLATRSFRSRGGRTTVTLELGAKARRAARRAGGLRLVTTIKGTAGRVTIDRRTVALRRR